MEVFVLDISGIGEDNYIQYLNILPEWRRLKAEKCTVDKEKYRSIGTGLLLMYGCKYFGVNASNEEVVEKEHGKPEFASGVIKFNLSHSGKMAAGIFGETESGIDIQVIRPINGKIARRYFLPEEFDYVSDDSVKFNQIWSLKESYLKAVGSGLTKSLDSFMTLPGVNMQIDDYYLRSEIMGDYALGICTKYGFFRKKITPLTLTDIENMLY